jgi:molecular chaperone GrpE
MLHKDKYLRSVAEFRNLQERTKRDMEGARNFAIQRFAKDLLESIDNFDRALLAVPKEQLEAARTEENKALFELVDGLKMTENILMNTLQKHGLERFDPGEKVDGKPQKFDPNLHEATFMAKAEGMENGDVMYAQTKGFRLNGRVLRVSFISWF